MVTRRAFLGGSAAVLAAGSRLAAFRPADSASGMAEIAKRIQPPKFPARDFDIAKYIAKYGAVAGGRDDCTQAIRDAIAACSAAGGGRVVVPPGVFLTGAIRLLSNVNLHVPEGATLLFSLDPKQYLPVVFTRWEGTECMNYSPLIYAFEATNIAVTGAGTLDGQANQEHWWPWKGNERSGWKAGQPNAIEDRNRLVAMGQKGVPVAERVFGEGHYLRPPFIQPYRCKNVLIEGIAIRNSPFWELHPVLSTNVTVRGVKISSLGPNNDGCDPESCTDVLIEGCEFNTGDDCIAIKSGRNNDGRRVAVACENLIVRDCRMKDGHGGVSIGSEVSGDVRNVYVDHCQMDSPHLERALRLKSNAVRGGIMENVFFTNSTVGEVSEAILDIDFNYEEADNGPFKPVVRNIVLEGITSKRSKRALYLRGFASAPITAVRVSHCDFQNAAEPNIIEHVEGLVLDDVKRNGKAM
jgi:polygalacturonase